MTMTADTQPRPVGRPLGDIHLAMLEAWREHGPATVIEIARRAQVGMQAAHRTASRMRAARAVVLVREGRPAVLGLPEHLVPPEPVMPSVLSFWELEMPP